MFVFNSNYKRPLTGADLERIARIKRASDSVYRYYDWLSQNPIEQDVGTVHADRIEALRQDVKVALFFGDHQDILVNYFIACVLFAIYNSHQEGAPTGTPCPIERSKLELMFNAAQVHELLLDSDFITLSYASGVFLMENNAPTELSSIELIRSGVLVMADAEMIETINLSQILTDEGMDQDDLLDSEVGAVFMTELLKHDQVLADMVTKIV